ncbi:PHP domain-containing protein, partial [Streptomyces sp. CBMA370]|uniref:PHP domain-containing protein n=1 Tax=Streptomyces sp. CBMA370 TaxID=1930278 RepID=UPI001661AB77
MRGIPHLHVSSGFSARFGASHPADLVTRAAERGIGTLALTDRDTVAGTVRFVKAATAAGIRPVLGVDLGVAAREPAPAGRRRTPVRGGAHVPEAPHRVTLLARDASGWARLCRLVSAAYTDAAASGGPVAASGDLLAAHAGEGVI